MKTFSLFATSAVLLFTACNVVHKPDINGSEHQPLMHGWTYEQAGEYWLQSTLDRERGEALNEGKSWMTPEQLASIDDENIQVRLPLAPEGTNPLPRNGITYRQAESDGFIKFQLMSEVELQADTILGATLRAEEYTASQLMTVGKADVWLKELMYFDTDTTTTCYVQKRGRGIYTLYYIMDRGTRSFPDGRIVSLAAVIAVHPGADSLTICRGNALEPAYVGEE